MKKLFLYVLMVFWALALFANDEEEDELVFEEDGKKLERKAIMGLEDMGFLESRINIPVEFCDEVSGEGCSSWNETVKFELNRKRKIKSAEIFYRWIVSKQFDKIIVGDGNAKIIEKDGAPTPIEAESIPIFSAGKGSIESFTKKMDKYLNTDFNDVMSGLLSESAQKRYDKLSSDEVERFIQKKAAKTGIPEEVVNKAIHSSYVFGLYIEKIGGYAKITKKKKKSRTSYDIIHSLSFDGELIVYRYDRKNEKFELYNKIGISGNAEETVSLKREPEKEDIQRAISLLFEETVKDSAKNGESKLRTDENFAVYTQIKEVEGQTVFAPIGMKENIRVDHPFAVVEQSGGKLKTKGLVKANSVFENCGEGGNTEFSLIKGSADAGNILVEQPWSGIYGNAGLGINSRTLQGKGNYKKNKQGGMMMGVQLGLSGNLGYITDVSFLSETWVSLFGSYTTGGQETKIPANDAAKIEKGSLSYPTFWGFGAEFSRRFYFGTAGLFAAPALAFSYDFGSITGKGSGENIDISSIFLTPNAHIGFSVNSGFDVLLKAGWNLPLAPTIKGSDSGNLNSDAELKGGLFAMVQLSFHLPIVGVTSKIYSAPADTCIEFEKTKKKQSNKDDEEDFSDEELDSEEDF